MAPPSAVAALRWLAPLALLLLSAVGCGHKIGDSCNTNVDCSPLGDRFCDVSAPGGYCTVEGCDVIMVQGLPTDTCPSEAVCVRFFQPDPKRSCDPANPGAMHHCNPNERCQCDCSDSMNPGACLMSSTSDCTVSTPGEFAHCAPESSERRSCERQCTSDGDCRGGYQCRQTGTHGAEPVPSHLSPSGIPIGTVTKFCVQVAPGVDMAAGRSPAAADLASPGDGALSGGG